MQTQEFDPELSPGNLLEREGYDAFVPETLPPEINLTNRLVSKLSEADRALGELAGIGRTVQNPHMLIQPFIRKEAVLSSRIEGTYAELSDVYAYEAGEEELIEGRARYDSKEVSNYVRAMENGLKRVDDHEITLGLIQDLHGTLLSGVRGEELTPGEFREVQNYIGNPADGIEFARFVPPDPSELPELLLNLESYIQHGNGYPTLIDLGLIHYQFETIHPFLDGNGRIGRLLISLMLVEKDILPQPFLYISAYFNQYKDEYCDLMLSISQNGDWEEWLVFFLQGLKNQAEEAFIRSNELLKLQEEYREEYQDRRSQTLMKLVYELFTTPYITAKQASERLSVTYPTANNAIKTLVEEGILVEVTGRSRNRFFIAEQIYRVINEPLHEIADVGPRAGRQADLREYSGN